MLLQILLIAAIAAILFPGIRRRLSRLALIGLGFILLFVLITSLVVDYT
ncbi:MAG: hypothetical protein AAF414_07865 [Pseudomonadota bacterium]